jgi:hypothetical protein
VRRMIVTLLAMQGPAIASEPGPCVPPSEVLERAEQALIDLRLETLPSLEARLEQSWACGPVAQVEDLSRAWLVQAAAQEIQGSQEQAEAAWQAAAILSPETWNPRLGPALRQQYEHAVALPTLPMGQLSLNQDLPSSLRIYVDGTETVMPTDVAVGPHLVQVVRGGSSSRGATLLRVAPNEQVQIDVDQFTLPPSQPRPSWSLATAGASLGLAAGTAWMARVQSQVMREAPNQESLNRAFTRQKLLAATSYGLGGLSIAGALTWVFY